MLVIPFKAPKKGMKTRFETKDVFSSKVLAINREDYKLAIALSNMYVYICSKITRHFFCYITEVIASPSYIDLYYFPILILMLYELYFKLKENRLLI